MATFTEIKAEIAEDLADSGVSFSNADLNESLQDAYDDISVLTGCIIKKASALDWEISQGYYDLSSLITDYFKCKAIYDNNHRRFLNDCVNLRQIEEVFGDDWENQHGTPELWTPVDPKRIVVVRKYLDPSSTFDVFYSAKAPTVVDGDTPLVATDMVKLFRNYCLGDMLEPYSEFASANQYWKDYYADIEVYAERVSNFSKADFMILI